MPESASHTRAASVQQRLTEQAELLQLLDLANDALLVRDLQGVLQYWSAGAHRLYGWTDEEAIGQPADELLQSVFPVDFEEVWAALLRNGRWEGELAQTRRDGSSLVVQSRWSLRRNAQGCPLAILIAESDVTDRQRTEEALRESEEKWRATVETNPTMYFVVDTAGTVVLVNAFGAARLGYSVEELLGQPVVNVFDERDREAIRRHTAACFQNPGSLMQWEARKIRKDGTMIWVRENANAVRLDNQPVVVVVCEDITEQKQAEEALREREARIRRLMESDIIGIFFWTLSGRITAANDAMLQIVGYSREELLSGELSWAALTPPVWAPADERAREQLLLRGTCEQYEKQYIHKEGRLVPVLIGGALFEGSQDEGVAFVLDLSERKQAEKDRQARLIAEAASRTKSQFLAHMSHELRTPLNGILGYAQILQQDAALSSAQQQRVSIIRQSGEHLLRLINDVLDLVKMDARKMKLFTDDLVLPPFLQLIHDIISLKAQQKHLDFVCQADPELPHCVRADETRLRQVLLNLLSNAVQFTDRGEVRLEVRRAGPNRLKFSVTDTGIGIPRDQLDRLFQPFEQISTLERGTHGTGLGLAICSSFVRLMGSEIHVASEAGGGSTFWFELELPVVDSGPSVPTAQSRPAPPPPPDCEDSRLVCAVPSPAELAHLHELALQGHMSQIAQEAARIARLDPRYQAFAAKVQTLAARYESRAVLRLIENIRTAASGSSE